jgi:hypothetical protein
LENTKALQAKCTPAAEPAAPDSFKGIFVPNQKAAATPNRDGSLDISDVKPGETVGLRPAPANGNIDNMVVIDEAGNEEVVSLPPVRETVYSESSKPAEDAGAVQGQPAAGAPAQPWARTRQWRALPGARSRRLRARCIARAVWCTATTRPADSTGYGGTISPCRRTCTTSRCPR